MSWDIAKSVGLVAELRGVSARSWPVLCSSDVEPRMAQRRASKACREGLLERHTVDRHTVYTATARGIRLHAPHVPLAWANTNVHLQRFAYWRSETWAALTRAGFTVTHSARGLARVRRYLIDHARGDSSVMARRRAALRASKHLALHHWTSCVCGTERKLSGRTPCPRCGSTEVTPRLAEVPGFCDVCGVLTERAGAVHATPEGLPCTARSKGRGTALSYDVAVRDGVPMLVLVDRPYRAVATAVADLPLDITPEQAPLDVLWVPTDGSYASEELAWLPSTRTAALKRSLGLFGSRRKQTHSVRAQNTNLLSWRLLDVPAGLWSGRWPLPGALREHIVRGASVLSRAQPIAWPKRPTQSVLVQFDEDARARLNALRDRLGTARSAQTLASACIAASLQSKALETPMEMSA